MTEFHGFKGKAKRIEDIDLPRIAHGIGVGEDIVHGIIDTESAGSGFDSQGRPKLLFEPHVFYRNLSGPKRAAAVKAGLAYPKWGMKPYPKESYTRLGKAISIDETAALKSASWGLGQVMGGNHGAAGYDTVQAMVADMMDDEDNHLEAMINFIKNSGLDDELRVMEKKIKAGKPLTPDDARAFVRGYNGPGYAKNNYHVKFARAVNKWMGIKDTEWSPDDDEAETAVEIAPETVAVGDSVLNLDTTPVDIYDGKEHAEVRAVQTRLDALGYPEVGELDGKWGTRTRAAILAFRADNTLPLTPTIDPELMAALMVATPRYVNPARANATLTDLRAEGARDVAAADNTDMVGKAAAGVGGLGLAAKAVEMFEGYGGIVKKVADTIEPIQGFIADNFWLLLLGGGAIVIWQTGILKRIRLEKHRTGNDVSM